MKFAFPACVLLALAGAASSSAIELFPSTPQNVILAPRDEITLVTGLTFLSVPGARSAKIEISGGGGADVDLFVRFGQRPRVRGEMIEADFSSQTDGTSDESVEILASSAPPLQTGIYYIGLLVKTLDVEIPLEIEVTTDLSGGRRTFIISTFDVDAEGWTRNFPPSGVPGATLGDSDAVLTRFPTGILRMTDLRTTGDRDSFVAPPKFLGNLANFSAAEFRFDIRKVNGPEALFPVELRVMGGGAAWVFRGPVLETGDWTAVTAPLDSSQWRRVLGIGSLNDALRNLDRIEVSMDHAVGPEETDLDNFVFEGGPAVSPPGAGAPDFSDFEAGLDGWSRNFPASSIPGASIGSEGASIRIGAPGSNSESFLMMIDGGEGGVDFVVAPPKFITGLAGLDRPWYEFDYRRIEGDFPAVGLILRLLGNGSVYTWRGGRPRNEWRTIRVPVDARYWLHESGPQDFAAMLRDVRRLEISMDHANGPEVSGLDNFYLRTAFTPPVGRALEIDRDAVTAAVGGEMRTAEEPLEITAIGADLSWQARIEPVQATWLNLSKYDGVTPDSTRLLFDAAGLRSGVYRAEIVVSSQEAGVAPQRLQVEFQVGDDPRVPVAETALNAAATLSPLSPGGLATIYGRFLAVQRRVLGFEPFGGLPVNADGFEIRVLDVDGNVIARAPLLYLSPTQVNFQIPYEVAGLAAIDLFPVRDGVIGERLRVSLSPAGPAVFSIEGGVATVVNPDGSLNSQASPAPGGSSVTVYFTGLGLVDPAVPSGRPAGMDPLSVPQTPYSATIDGSPAPVSGTALSPGYVGLAQMTVAVSSELSGRRVLQIAVGGVNSNSVFLWVQ